MILLRIQLCATLHFVLLAAACGDAPDISNAGKESAEYYGTLDPFAAEAVYFVMTDRFVDGDVKNNQESQGGDDRGTFDRAITTPDGKRGNIGYLGGDFAGILDNAQYITQMGFSAVWITPIVDNPDEAFTGGLTLEESRFADRGKTGFHGYWGVNFFKVDEHLESVGLSFADFTRRMLEEHGLKTVLDVVCNHGSPSFTMPVDQPKFGEIYGRDGTLLADHQNLEPADLDPQNPLHGFFHTEADIAQLSNINDENPEVLEYFVAATLQWIDEGASALRIDTLKHMPHAYWSSFANRIRQANPDIFIFGESYNFDSAEIAEHTYPENGGISVLDFPGQERMNEIFANGGSYSLILDALHLSDGVYQNPYELMTWYDNHDVPRMGASHEGFIDANNWLFTSRGIPVVYYGSEMAFRAGAAEHAGNRDYFGEENIAVSTGHPIRHALSIVGNIRRESPALQRGLQVNIEFDDDTAAFYRVYQSGGVNQTALVLLNKGADVKTFEVNRWLSHGNWRDAVSGETLSVPELSPQLSASVSPHGLRIMVFDAPNNNPGLAEELDRLQANRLHKRN